MAENVPEFIQAAVKESQGTFASGIEFDISASGRYLFGLSTDAGSFSLLHNQLPLPMVNAMISGFVTAGFVSLGHNGDWVVTAGGLLSCHIGNPETKSLVIGSGKQVIVRCASLNTTESFP